jgi:hypothetical protein
MSEPGTLALRRDELTKLVGRAAPFQLTFEPETKPEPFTVSVNPAPPGATLVGISGSLIKGTGFGLCPDNGSPLQAKTNKTRKTQTQRTDVFIVHSYEGSILRGAAPCFVRPQLATWRDYTID